MRIVVLGRNGQVAGALVRRAPRHGVNVITLGRPQVDLERPETIAPAISASAPDVIINAAAFTAVDRAETERARAFAVNAVGAEAVARTAAEIGAPVVHLSTDYVFGGDKSSAYVEDDAVGPRSVYGASKLEGEQRVWAVNRNSLIVRTAWIFCEEGRNFVRSMLRLADTREEISVVRDQLGCPTYAHDLADSLFVVAKQNASRPGIYHCAGSGETSWATFAEEIFRLSRARGGPTARVSAIPTSAYPTPAQRPANSRLECGKIAAEYLVRMRPWQDALADCVDAIAAGGWRVG